MFQDSPTDGNYYTSTTSTTITTLTFAHLKTHNIFFSNITNQLKGHLLEYRQNCKHSHLASKINNDMFHMALRGMIADSSSDRSNSSLSLNLNCQNSVNM